MQAAAAEARELLVALGEGIRLDQLGRLGHHLERAVGLALSGSALNWLLTHYHDFVLALMIGLMVGSLRVLWPWPHGLGNPEMALPTATPALLPIVLGVGGFALVMSAEAIAKRVRRDDQLA